MIDHVGIYGARVAEGLSASNVGLVGFSATYIRDFTVVGILWYHIAYVDIV